MEFGKKARWKAVGYSRIYKNKFAIKVSGKKD